MRSDVLNNMVCNTIVPYPIDGTVREAFWGLVTMPKKLIHPVAKAPRSPSWRADARMQLQKKSKNELLEMLLDSMVDPKPQETDVPAELQRVYEALDLIKDPIALFDADDRFVFVNTAYKGVNSSVDYTLKQGSQFEFHVMELLDKGMIPAALGRESEWLSERMKQHRNPHGTPEQIRDDGTVLKVRENRLSEGSTVLIAENVTAQRRADEALVVSETARVLMINAIDEISEGIALFDEHDRLALANKSWWRMNSSLAGKTKPGTTFTEHIWNCIDAGLIPPAIGQEKEWVEQRVKTHLKPGKPFEVERSCGRVNFVREQVLSNGYRILIVLEITEQKRLQRRLEEAVESLNEGFVLFDNEGRLVISNSKFSEVFGPAVGELEPGTSFETLFRASVARGLHSGRKSDDEAFIKNRVADFFRCEGAREMQLSDGRWFRSTERKTPSGEIVALRSDITELKRREQEATHAEEMLLDAIESISEGFILFDADRRMLMCNSKYKDYYPALDDVLMPGVSFAELVDAMIASEGIEISESSPGAWKAQRLKQFKTGKGVHQQHLSDGRWVQVVERPTKSGGVVGIRTEITDIVNAERESRRALEDAERANKAKSEFLGNMSHELRTPLNAIIGFSSVISNQLYGPVDNASYLEYAGDIQKSGEHLLTLIGDLLDISRIEAGEVSMARGKLDVGHAVRDCVRMVERQCNEKYIHLNIQIKDDLPALFADARHFRQILINIVANAIKFTPPHGTISINADLVSNRVASIRISDSGVGISVENLDLVLEPFGQVADTLTRNHDGVGLGLPIVKSLVELHNGTLSLKSEVGKGTVVELQMPIFLSDKN